MTTIIYEYEIPNVSRPVPDYLGPPGCEFELMAFYPKRLAPHHVVGRTVVEYSTMVGTYGMGGPGFFGLSFGDEWLVVAVWGAASWMIAENRFILDYRHLEHARPEPWIVEPDLEHNSLATRIIRNTISGIHVDAKSLRIEFVDGFCLEIDPDPSKRPEWEGTGQLKLFAEEDDLRRAVFLCPTHEIWI
jgi:hypothetical protein